MIALAGMATLGVAMVLVTFTLNQLGGWNLDAACPGTPSFCNGIYWKAVVEYLPTWLFIGQILVVLALSSPYALLRAGR